MSTKFVTAALIMHIGMLSMDSTASTEYIYNGTAGQPNFSEPLKNITVTEGETATFHCTVNNIGGHRIAWLQAQKRHVLAMGDVTITPEQQERISAGRINENTWAFSITDVRWEDRGTYMCQINTHPVKSTVAQLIVLVPPKIISDETSNDVVVPEGGDVKLTCQARGHPKPAIFWSRENGTRINLHYGNSAKGKSAFYSVSGNLIYLKQVSRTDMGRYMCVANNNVKPTDKRVISLQVTFSPVMSVREQLIGTTVGSQVTLQCTIEAFPEPMKFWVRADTEKLISNSAKYEVHEKQINVYTHIMSLVIKTVEENDFGEYKCYSRNSISESATSINLYDIIKTNNGKVKQNSIDLMITSADEANVTQYLHATEEDAAVTNEPQKATSNKSATKICLIMTISVSIVATLTRIVQ